MLQPSLTRKFYYIKIQICQERYESAIAIIPWLERVLPQSNLPNVE
jgi:hypothetical protein